MSDKNLKFDKWYELRQFLSTGMDYDALPADQRKAYSLAFEKMDDLEATEKRFNPIEPSIINGELLRMMAVNQQLEIELSDQRAITELAVKELQFYADGTNYDRHENDRKDGLNNPSAYDIDFGKHARTTLSEIERLQK